MTNSSMKRAGVSAAMTMAIAGFALLLGAAPVAAEGPTGLGFTFGAPGGGDGEFGSAGDIEFSPLGSLYVSDFDVESSAVRVQEFSADGTYVDQFGVDVEGRALAVDGDGDLLVLAAQQVQEYDPNGTPLGEWGGPGTGDGEFQGAVELTVDADGNIYVVDGNLSRIQKFDAAGTYLDQWGTPGSGVGQFDSPSDIEFGPDGSLYVADATNGRIQVFDTDGTFLRQWSTGATGGNPSLGPSDIAFESDGDAVVLVGLHGVHGYTPSGTPEWSLTAAGSSVTRAAVGPDDRIYITHATEVSVFGVVGLAVSASSPQSDSAVVAGAAIDYQLDLENSGTNPLTNVETASEIPACTGPVGDLGPGDTGQTECTYTTTPGDVGTLVIQSQVDSDQTTPVPANEITVEVLPSPVSVTMSADPSHVEIGETVTFQIEITNDGDEPLTGVAVSDPVAPDCEGGVEDIPVGQSTTVDCSRRVDADDAGGFENVAEVTTDQAPPAVAGQFVNVPHPAVVAPIRQWGTLGDGPGEFDQPSGVDIGPNGDAYVADRGNNRIQHFDRDGEFVSSWGTTGSGDGQFDEPFGVATDNAGNVYVADTGNNRVQKFTPAGVFVTAWGSGGSGNGQFSAPADIAIAAGGNVLVTDALNSRVQEFTPTGTFVTSWASGLSTAGIAVGPAGDVYVTRSLQGDVRRHSSAGAFVAAFDEPPSGFDLPLGIAVHPGSRVYVADTGNNRIRSYTADGVRIADIGEDGSSLGQLDQPRGIDIDAGGARMLVADTGNNRIQEFAFEQQPRMAAGITTDQGAVTAGDVVDLHLTIANTGNTALTDVAIASDDALTCAAPVADVPAFQDLIVDCSHTATAADAVAGVYRAEATVSSAQADDATTNEVSVDVSHRRRSDGQIRLGNGAFVGTTTYNTNGAGQSRTATVGARGSARFTVRVQNDGTGADTFRVKGLGSTNRFAVTYRNGATDVTNQVVAGTFQYSGVAPGATRNLTVVIQARNGTPRNATISRLVTVTSPTPTAVKDTVKATVTRR